MVKTTINLKRKRNGLIF